MARVQGLTNWCRILETLHRTRCSVLYRTGLIAGFPRRGWPESYWKPNLLERSLVIRLDDKEFAAHVGAKHPKSRARKSKKVQSSTPSRQNVQN